MRVASVQLNSRNTDGTLSEAAKRVATVRDMRAGRWKEGERSKSAHFMKAAGVTSPSLSFPRQGSSKCFDVAPLGAATSASPISRASASPISRSRERERERSHPPSPSPTHEARQQQHEGWHNASVLSSASSGNFMTESGSGSVRTRWSAKCTHCRGCLRGDCALLLGRRPYAHVGRRQWAHCHLGLDFAAETRAHPRH